MPGGHSDLESAGQHYTHSHHPNITQLPSTMDRSTTKRNLRELLDNPAYGVIALTGSWGSGKTHLWRELAEEDRRAHSYYSLFGAKDAAQIKKGLALSRIDLDDDQGAQIQSVWKRVTPYMSKALDGLAESNGLVGAVSTAVGELIGESVVSRLVGGIAVLDDIERADAKLSISAIMGVIDSLRRAGCKVVVILSASNLSTEAHGKWKEFYEKTIDIELTLQTDSADAFHAIRSLVTDRWLLHVRKAWLDSKCTNIRIAQRVARVVETIFKDTQLHDGLAGTLIADAVWLTVAQFHGFDREFDAADVLRVARSFILDTESDPRAKEIRSRLPISLSYHQDFQDSVVTFLKTGNIDRTTWDTQFESMDSAYRSGNILGRLTSWISQAHWDPVKSDAEFRQEAQELLQHAYLLKLQDAQGFMSGLREIGSGDLVEEFVQAWLAGVEKHQLAYPMDLVYGSLDGIDPRMMDLTRTIHSKLAVPPNLDEALRRILSSGGWSSEHEKAINDATEADWRLFLQTGSNGDHLRLLRKLIESNYAPVSTGIATAKHTCQEIAHREPDSRLGRLLRERSILPRENKAAMTMPPQGDTPKT